MATFTKVCFYCREEFEASHALANKCSPDCHRTIARAVVSRPVQEPSAPPSLPGEPKPRRKDNGKPPQKATPGARPCRRCGKGVPPSPADRVYCSPGCRRAVRNKARKTLLRNARDETVSMAVLRERDRDTCRLCGEPIDFTKKPPEPRAATIDHILALSRGGRHSYGNTQLAHFGCNMAKGAN